MRSIIAKHKAVYEPIADLETYRAMPTPQVHMNKFDPFIFLNHHGRQVYPPGNNGLPFGPHPHRGFETVTFILEGDLTHKDSGGGESVIKEGGIQWMTAGSGLIHAEISSDAFKAEGGPLEILQLWVNLPAKYKMTEPKYIGLQESEIPVAEPDSGKVKVQAISGNWNGTKGAIEPLTDIALSCIRFSAGGKMDIVIPNGKNIFFYVVKGVVNVNDVDCSMHHLVEFADDDEEIAIEAKDNSIILLGHATPFNEPFIAYGPFVMNTEDEIRQAYRDYQAGRFGDETAF